MNLLPDRLALAQQAIHNKQRMRALLRQSVILGTERG
jgi:hypothetical protein